jgi:transcriptional regulator with XRE-family HTH domain
MARKPRPEAERKADVALGRRLAQIRKERGFTQIELATKVGVLQSIISDYETARLRIHPTMLGKLAEVLQVTTDELLGRVRIPKQPPVNRRFLRRLQALDKLPKRDQDALLRTIDAFLAARKAS